MQNDVVWSDLSHLKINVRARFTVSRRNERLPKSKGGGLSIKGTFDERLLEPDLHLEDGLLYRGLIAFFSPSDRLPYCERALFRGPARGAQALQESNRRSMKRAVNYPGGPGRCRSQSWSFRSETSADGWSWVLDGEGSGAE